jgi:hypothetical protein
MARAVSPNPDAPASEAGQDSINRTQQAILEKKFNDSRSAFTSWETAQNRTDQQLYTAIGRLSEFAAAVGNDHDALTAFAAEKGVRATKASTPYTVIVKLVLSTDRKKASKYAIQSQRVPTITGVSNVMYPCSEPNTKFALA